jgi:hypothetical protein
LETRQHVTDGQTLQQLADEIREKARHPSRIALSTHAMQRAGERGTTPADTLRVLRTGRFDGPVLVNAGSREYRFRMAASVRGVPVTLAAVMRIDGAGRIFVITVGKISGNGNFGDEDSGDEDSGDEGGL